MSFKRMVRLAALTAAIAIPFAANAQWGKWAATGDVTAKSLIDMERQWAEAACTHGVIVQTILADDFQGTSPDGKRYSKAEAVESEKNPKTEARECRLNDANLERGRLIHLDGPSGRTRHLNLEDILPAKSERVRISGNNGSEFPEPTLLRECATTARKK